MSQFQQANVGRRIVCSAVRAEDGSVLIGIRHYSADMHEQIAARADGEKFRHRPGRDNGFVDQHGKFLTRAEAYQVAYYAKQIVRTTPFAFYEPPLLDSEALY